MKSLILLALCAFSAITLVAQEQSILRVGSLNLQEADGCKADSQAIAETVRELDVGVLAVQGLRSKDRLREIAACLGRSWHYLQTRPAPNENAIVGRRVDRTKRATLIETGTPHEFTGLRGRRSEAFRGSWSRRTGDVAHDNAIDGDRAGFLFDGTKVELLSAEELIGLRGSTPGAPFFAVSPLSACFRSTNREVDFRAVCVEFTPDGGLGADGRQEQEATSLHAYLRSLLDDPNEDHDIVLLGDIGTGRKKDMVRLIEQGDSARVLLPNAEVTSRNASTPTTAMVAVAPDFSELAGRSLCVSNRASVDAKATIPTVDSAHAPITFEIDCTRDKDPLAWFSWQAKTNQLLPDSVEARAQSGTVAGPKQGFPGTSTAAECRDVAIVLVVDRSGSMGTPVGNTGNTRMSYAKASALKTAEALQGGDQVGIISFGNDDQEVVVLPMTKATETAKIKAGVEQLHHYNNEQTWLRSALMRAKDLLHNGKFAVRHVVVITDGEIYSEEFTILREKAHELRSQGITVSIVQVGGSSMNTTAGNNPEDITRDGGGRYLPVSDPTRVPVFVLMEVTRALGNVGRKPLSEGDRPGNNTEPGQEESEPRKPEPPIKGIQQDPSLGPSSPSSRHSAEGKVQQDAGVTQTTPTEPVIPIGTNVQIHLRDGTSWSGTLLQPLGHAWVYIRAPDKTIAVPAEFVAFLIQQ